jgi:short-subunit dehydrogenase
MTKDPRRNILITGASSGIGEALAKRYARADTRLILLARNIEKLERVAKSCEQKQAIAIIHSIDITETEALQTLIASIDAEFPIDLVICNAGVTSVLDDEGNAESWSTICHVIDTNLYGVLATLNPLISELKKRKRGQIAIISSLAAYYGMPITPVYCASKSALKGYGESLRGWLKQDGIKVSMIYPGFVKSDLSDKFTSDKPFMISPESAADIIYKGIKKNKASISFPFPLNFGIWILSVLPSSLASWIMGVLYSTKNTSKKKT